MGHDFWMGKDAGPTYKTPAYNTGANQILGLKAEENAAAYQDKLGKMQGGAEQQWGQFGQELLTAMRGQTPSAAEKQMQAGLQQNAQAALAMSRSNPGMSPGLAARQAQQANQGAALGSIGQAAALRAQEQATARQQFGSYLQAFEQMRQAYMAQGMSAQQAAEAAQIELERQRQAAWATEHGITAGSSQPGTPGFLSNLANAAAAGGAKLLGSLAG